MSEVSTLVDKYREFAKGRGDDLTSDEAQRIIQKVWSKFDGYGDLIWVYDCIQREFTRGERCSVCGNTAEQSKALNYDCINEC
jgi:hypothetical protein